LCNYEKYHAGEKPGQDKTRWMGDLFAEADRRFASQEGFEAEVRAYFARWDARDPHILALWKETRDWSLDGFRQVYELLGNTLTALLRERSRRTGKSHGRPAD
jgi:arginyl-tRNA synthetase